MAYDPFLGRELQTTGATLIITPLPLLDQWLSELNRHAPSLQVVYYPGLKKAAKMKGVDLSAKQLSQQDVVITTYEVLRTEIWSAVDCPERAMRGEKQYERQTSPLVELGWWRVCIDEAQMVDNWTSNAAVFARRIPRVHAWAITGTPVKDDIQKGKILVRLDVSNFTFEQGLMDCVQICEAFSISSVLSLMRRIKTLGKP